jgi:hypothetical protein
MGVKYSLQPFNYSKYSLNFGVVVVGGNIVVFGITIITTVFPNNSLPGFK